MLRFIIKGNHEDETGNPLPKARKTYRQQWTPAAKKYHQWLDYVRDKFREAARNSKIEKYLTREFDRKPLNTGKRKCRMFIRIFWKGDLHGDPENIFGSIADALFVNDKYLSGGFDFEQSENKEARVEVEIEIEDGCCIHSGKSKQVGK